MALRNTVLRGIIYGVAFIVLAPLLLWSLLPLGHFSAFTAPSQLLALLPGHIGIVLRRVWYRLKLRRCGDRLTVDWLAVIRHQDSEIGDRVTLGVANWVGWVRIGNDVMTGSHVIMLSGARQHDFTDLSHPMRTIKGEKRQLVLGNDLWIGANAILMADVADQTVVGAGSVVTRTYDKQMVLAGNPARILRHRSDENRHS